MSWFDFHGTAVGYLAAIAVGAAAVVLWVHRYERRTPSQRYMDDLARAHRRFDRAQGWQR